MPADDEQQTQPPKPITADPHITELAWQKLKDPNLLGWVEQVLDTDAGIVRERRNKLYLFLCLLSGHSKEPKVQQMVQIRGNSRAGKSFMAAKVAQFFKTKDLGSITSQVIKYMTDLKDHEVLFLQELLDVDKEHSEVRLMSAEDGGFKFAVTVAKKDGTGFEAKEGKIDPIAFLVTTTRFDVDEQFVNRTHILNIDESVKQTEHLLDRYDTIEYQKILRKLGIKKPSQNIAILKRVVELLDPNITVAVTTQSIIRKLFPIHENLRIRSDYFKILNLTRMITYLYQYQRPYISIVNPDTNAPDKIILSLPQDAYYTLELVNEPILTMSTGLEGRQRHILPALAEMYDKKVIIKGVEVTGFTVADIKPYLGMGRSSSVKKQLDSLIAEDILEVHTISGETIYKINISADKLQAMLEVGDTIKGAADLLKQASAEAKEVFDALETDTSAKFSIPADMFAITPIPQWFDDNYTGSMVNVNQKAFGIELTETAVKTDIEHTIFNDSEFWAIYEKNILQQIKRRNPKFTKAQINELLVTEHRLVKAITKNNDSEIFYDTLAKWVYSEQKDYLAERKKSYMALSSLLVDGLADKLYIIEEADNLTDWIIHATNVISVHEMLHQPNIINTKIGKNTPDEEFKIEWLVKRFVIKADV